MERAFSESKFKQIQKAHHSILIKNCADGKPRYRKRPSTTSSSETLRSFEKTVLLAVSRPGWFISELRSINFYAMGSPVATSRSATRDNVYDLGIRSVYVQTVQLPLEDLYKGIPLFRFELKDNLFTRYRASIRGQFFFFSLYQAGCLAIPLVKTSKVLAAIIGFYVVHGTTPIPDPKASFATRIQRGTKGGEKAVRFAKWYELETVFRIKEAPHPIYRRIGNDLHAQLVLTSNEAENGCVTLLEALDSTAEEAIEITIPANKYSYQMEPKHQRKPRTWWRRRKRKQQQEQSSSSSSSTDSSIRYDNTIRIRGRGWPIRCNKFYSDVFLYGDLIVTVRVTEPSSKPNC